MIIRASTGRSSEGPATAVGAAPPSSALRAPSPIKGEGDGAGRAGTSGSVRSASAPGGLGQSSPHQMTRAGRDGCPAGSRRCGDFRPAPQPGFSARSVGGGATSPPHAGHPHPPREVPRERLGPGAEPGTRGREPGAGLLSGARRPIRPRRGKRAPHRPGFRPPTTLMIRARQADERSLRLPARAWIDFCKRLRRLAKFGFERLRDLGKGDEEIARHQGAGVGEGGFERGVRAR